MSNEILEEFYVGMFKVHCTKYMYPSKREYLGSREKRNSIHYYWGTVLHKLTLFILSLLLMLEGFWAWPELEQLKILTKNYFKCALV